MAEVASAFVSLMPSARGFGSSAQRQIAPQMTGVAKTTGSRFGKVFASASMSPLKAIGVAAVGLFAVAKVKDFFQGAIAEARESQKVSALTAQVIKSTGGAAGVSAKQVGQLANSISLLTGIDDEAIQGAENLLLTFTNLRNEAGKGNDVFNQATKIVTDMSVALDQDLKSSSIQVGKALNDPIKGLTALTRVGVAFTDQQKEQITALTESGHRLQAQKIILGELNKEFGGAAAAAATSGDKFKTAFANLQESVGLALLPLFDKLLDRGTVFLNWMITNVPPAFAAFKAAVMPLVAVIDDFVTNHLTAFKTALAGLGGATIASLIALIGGGLVGAIVALVGALTAPIALIGALAGALVYAYLHFEGFRTAVNNLAMWIKTNLVPALVQIGQVVRAEVLPILASLASWIVGTFYPAMFKFWGVVAQKLKPAFDQLVASLRANVIPALQQALAEFRQWQPTLQKVAGILLKVQLAIDAFGASIIGKALPPLIKFAAFLIGNQVRALTAVAHAIASTIAALARFGGALADGVQAAARFAAGVKQKFDEVVAAAKTLGGKIVSALSGFVSDLYNVGRDMILGLINGIKAMATTVASAARSVVEGAVKAAKDALHIGSPSKVFHEIGGFTMQGLVNGLLAGAPAAIAAATGVAVKIQSGVLDNLTSMRDKVKGVLDGLKSDFASLRDSITSTFSGDLFQATSLTDFISQSASQAGLLGQLKAAFRKLRKWGIDPQFLAQLFASGNSALILDMAEGSRSDVKDAAALFDWVGHQANGLGGAVAQNTYGDLIRGTNQRLDKIEQAIKHIGKDVGREINGAASHAQRSKAHRRSHA